MAKVLLAEDDPTMVGLLKTLLSMEGFQVTMIDPGEDVLPAVRRETPDVLLLDVHLYGMNGLDIIGDLRKADDLKSLRVVMTSGMSLAEECLDKGANDFLLKPYMPDDLIAIIKKQLVTPS
jgi:DNA-binding response OmpR family regulator